MRPKFWIVPFVWHPKIDFRQPAASRLLKVNNMDFTYMLPSGLWCASRARAFFWPRSRTCSKLPRVIFLFFRVPTQQQSPSLVFSTLPRVRCCAVHSEKRLSTCGRKPRRQKRQKTVDSRPTSADFLVGAPLYLPHRVSHDQICPFFHEDPCTENPTSTRERERGRVQFCRACSEVLIILDDTRGRSLRCPAVSPSRHSGARHFQRPRAHI